MSFFTGFGVSAFIYYLLNFVFPVPGFTKDFQEVDLSEVVYENQGSDASSVNEPVTNLSSKDKIVDHSVHEVAQGL